MVALWLHGRVARRIDAEMADPSGPYHPDYLDASTIGNSLMEGDSLILGSEYVEVLPMVVQVQRPVLQHRLSPGPRPTHPKARHETRSLQPPAPCRLAVRG